MKARRVLSIQELQARGVVAITKAQMAAAIQVCPRTISEMMRRGEIAYYRIGKRLVRFRIEDAIKQMNETVLVAADGEPADTGNPNPEIRNPRGNH